MYKSFWLFLKKLHVIKYKLYSANLIYLLNLCQKEYVLYQLQTQTKLQKEISK